jgi:outer membrane protein OmpA-like peptidoglycan-associated protein
MNANARRVRTMTGAGVACAMAVVLSCGIGAASAADTGDKPRKSAPAEENIGFFSGLAVGAVAGGPIGAVAGGITGALLGEHYHKQKALNRQLATDLSGSNAGKAQMAAALDHARDLTLNIAFRTGDATLTPADIDRLTALAQLAGGLVDVKIQVSGYADPRGAAEYNLGLSKERAESVAAALAKSGLDKDRIVTEAFGANGATANGDLDGYAFQRRVSVRLVSGTTAVAGVAGPAATTVAQAE